MFSQACVSHSVHGGGACVHGRGCTCIVGVRACVHGRGTCVTGDMHGRQHAWWGHAWQRHVWQSVHGWGMYGGGHACMAGVCMAGTHMWYGCMALGMHTFMEGVHMHDGGMHSRGSMHG